MRLSLKTTLGLMGIVVCVAVLLAVLRFLRLKWVAVLLVLAVVGPICGTVTQRRIGGRGILGGIAGGVISYFVFGVIYLSGYSGVAGLTTQTLGPVMLLVFFAYWGALAGFGVGIVAWGLMPDKKQPRKR